MENLPNGIFSNILIYLSHSDIYHLSLTNKNLMNKILDEKEIYVISKNIKDIEIRNKIVSSKSIYDFLFSIFFSSTFHLYPYYQIIQLFQLSKQCVNNTYYVYPFQYYKNRAEKLVDYFQYLLQDSNKQKIKSNKIKHIFLTWRLEFQNKEPKVLLSSCSIQKSNELCYNVNFYYKNNECHLELSEKTDIIDEYQHDIENPLTSIIYPFLSRDRVYWLKTSFPSYALEFIIHNLQNKIEYKKLNENIIKYQTDCNPSHKFYSFHIHHDRHILDIVNTIQF